jgi:hypothetical protein
MVNLLVLALIIGGILLVGAGLVVFLLKLGVIGYFAATQENDRGESANYDLDQSGPPDAVD